MSKEKSIQELFDQARAESKLNDPRINVKVENLRRKNDKDFKESCTSAQSLRKGKPGKPNVNLRVPIMTPWGEFAMVKEFNKWAQSKIEDFNGWSINYHDKQKSLPHLYYRIEDGPGEVLNEEVFNTPYGIAPAGKGGRGPQPTLKDLLQSAKSANDPDANNKFAFDWFKKMNYRYPDKYYKNAQPKREWLVEKLN